MQMMRDVSNSRFGQTVFVCVGNSVVKGDKTVADYHAGQNYVLINYSAPNAILGLLGQTSGSVALPASHSPVSRKSPKAQDLRSVDYLARHHYKHWSKVHVNPASKGIPQ
jgi:hypothetical protein